jgi:hypothetical protein
MRRFAPLFEQFEKLFSEGVDDSVVQEAWNVIVAHDVMTS